MRQEKWTKQNVNWGSTFRMSESYMKPFERMSLGTFLIIDPKHKVCIINCCECTCICLYCIYLTNDYDFQHVCASYWRVQASRSSTALELTHYCNELSLLSLVLIRLLASGPFHEQGKLPAKSSPKQKIVPFLPKCRVANRRTTDMPG